MSVPVAMFCFNPGHRCKSYRLYLSGVEASDKPGRFSLLSDFRFGDAGFNGEFVNIDPTDPECTATASYLCGNAQIDYSRISIR